MPEAIYFQDLNFRNGQTSEVRIHLNNIKHFTLYLTEKSCVLPDIIQLVNTICCSHNLVSHITSHVSSVYTKCSFKQAILNSYRILISS